MTTASGFWWTLKCWVAYLYFARKRPVDEHLNPLAIILQVLLWVASACLGPGHCAGSLGLERLEPISGHPVWAVRRGWVKPGNPGARAREIPRAVGVQRPSLLQDKGAKPAPPGGEFQLGCAPRRRRGGARPRDPASRRASPRESARAHRHCRCERGASGFQEPALSQERDAGPGAVTRGLGCGMRVSGTRRDRGTRSRWAGRWCHGPRVHGATCGPPDGVSLGASPAREERAGGSWPLWSHSLNGAWVLMRRRPEATSFMFQVSVSLQAVGPVRPEAPAPSNLWFRAAVGQLCSPATPRKVEDLQSNQPGVLA